MPGSSRAMSALWRGLDPGLRDMLLLGSCGHGHLLSATRKALASAPELFPALEMLRGQAAFLAGKFAEAQGHFAAAAPALGPAVLFRQGLCSRALGDRQGAIDHFQRCLEQVPWHSSAALLAADLLWGRDQALAPIPGSLAVLLYSWNKAAELDQTLAAL